MSTTITIPLPEAEKKILTDFCQITERTQTDVIRACIRSLADELPYFYGLMGTEGTDPVLYHVKDGRKLTEAEFRAEFPEAYQYWLQQYGRPVRSQRIISRTVL